MLYKPNYCCQCGEKIERLQWFLWTSRSFCEVCETEFKFANRLPLLILFCGVALSVFGIGTYLKNNGERSSLIVKQVGSEDKKQNQPESVRQTASEMPVNVRNFVQKESNRISIENKAAEASETADGRVVQAKDKAEDVTYYCGAETKKGTPCSRRVRGGGRCFQHKGQTAMLPPEKLVVGGG